MEDFCVTCAQPLVLRIDSDEEGDHEPGSSNGPEQIVPDSVKLACGCLFHWSVILLSLFCIVAINTHASSRECLLDGYSMNECPSCGENVAKTSNAGTEQILCDLNNEGGLQEGLDIMPLLVEASYLKAYPEERKGRAFVEIAGEGDAMSMLDMLIEHDDDIERDGQPTSVDVLRYQDPLGGMNSALHAAVVNGNEGVVWLLLWLASSLDSSAFPADVVQPAIEMGILRGHMANQDDIRCLTNSEGKTAAKLAEEDGGLWARWVDAGWLNP